MDHEVLLRASDRNLLCIIVQAALAWLGHCCQRKRLGTPCGAARRGCGSVATAKVFDALGVDNQRFVVSLCETELIGLGFKMMRKDNRCQEPVASMGRAGEVPGRRTCQSPDSKSSSNARIARLHNQLCTFSSELRTWTNGLCKPYQVTLEQRGPPRDCACVLARNAQ